MNEGNSWYKAQPIFEPQWKSFQSSSGGGMNENKTIIVHTDVVRKRKTVLFEDEREVMEDGQQAN